MSWHGWTWDHLEGLSVSRWNGKRDEDIPGQGMLRGGNEPSVGRQEREMAGLEPRSVQGELAWDRWARLTADWEHESKEWT